MFLNKQVTDSIIPSTILECQLFEAAATDMKYFARSKFSRCSVHKKNFSLIWPVVFKLRYVFCQER